MRKLIAVGIVTALTVCGCGVPRMTDTARTGIERLVLTTAADRVMGQLDIAQLAGKKVFLDASQFEGTDKAYAVAALRDRLGSQGLLLVDGKDKAEVVIEARAGAIETDSSSFLIGIPAIPVPMGGAAVVLPELAIFKKVKQIGTAKVALNAVTTPEGKQVGSTGTKSARSYFTRYTILFFIHFNRSDVPESQGVRY